MSDAHVKTMSVSDLPQELFDELEKYINTLEDKEGSLIHVLHKAQGLFGYLPREVQLFVARKLNIPGAKVFGVVSFYSFFTQTPRGKHTISVCMGTACFVKGVEKVMDEFSSQLGIKNGETTTDGQFTLRDVRCIGACGLAPVVMVDEKVFGHVTKDDVAQILKDYRGE
ncbi:MAG: NADH-quinone oxidoreductase subunit NuoE [Clostridia bacterium]|nr:NADH-quinone oxidoreductase subunit NuoE [Clostridia bacterium]